MFKLTKDTKGEIKNILLLSLFSTLLTFIVAWIGFSIFENKYPQILEIWNRWDTRFYLRIAEVGYPSSDEGRFLITVLPLYPWLVRLASLIFGNHLISSLVISNISLAVALIFFYKLVRLDFSENIAWRTIVYLLIFPSAYFLHGGYSESTFIMFTLISAFFARKEKWFQAALFGIFAVLTRITGVVVLPFLLAEYFHSKKFKLTKVKSDILLLSLPALGFLYYLLINYRTFGHPFEFLASLRVYFWEWPSLPWQWLERALSRFYILGPADWMIEGGMIILFWIFGLLLLIYSVKKLRFSYNVFAWLSFLFVSSTTTLSSLPRFILTFFPLFIVLALWGKNKMKHFIITFTFVALQTMFIILFVREHWAF